MISLNGPTPATCWTGVAGASTSGSGYGTSSGSKRATIEASQTISPPARRTSTSESPSTRCPFTDRVRPVLKKTSSAFAGDATSAATRRTAEHRTARILNALPWIDVRVKDADAQFSRILVAGHKHGRHVGLIDRNDELRHVCPAHLRCFQRNPSQFG